MKQALGLLLFVAAIAAIYFSSRPELYVWALPATHPRPVVPIDNPMSATKVELGRWLFYDQRLSGNTSMSCASCHIQALAFTDGRAQSVGSTGDQHPRNAMSLVNSAYSSRLTWANPLLDKLEDQALTPLFGENPVEMGMSHRNGEVADLLAGDARYQVLARIAFPDDAVPYSTLNAVRSIAAFVRSIISFDSPYDKYLAGDDRALSRAALRGMDLFFSERLECFHCHGGFNFTDSTTHENAAVEAAGFHNTGLYNVAATGAYPAENTGLYDMTGLRRDMGRFRAPTLRNVTLTAPYMHDGSIASLEKVLEHYAGGGRLIEEGEFSGDGRLNPFKSEFIKGFELSASETLDLVAFLQALTDESVVENTAWSDPSTAGIRQSNSDSAVH